MPILENHTEHLFDFPAEPRTTADGAYVAPNQSDAVIVPPMRPKAQADGSSVNVPGTATVTPAQLERMQKHPVARHWFGPTSLVVKPDPQVKAKG